MHISCTCFEWICYGNICIGGHAREPSLLLLQSGARSRRVLSASPPLRAPTRAPILQRAHRPQRRSRVFESRLSRLIPVTRLARGGGSEH